MGLINYEDDVEYAFTRLYNSIVKNLEGIPVRVTGRNGNDAFDVENLVNGSFEKVTLHELDLSPFRLGYVNTETSCFYAYRTPIRKWKQGLDRSNVRGIGNPYVIIVSTPFVQMLRNIYPTLETCYEEIMNEEILRKAFSRNFCLARYHEDIHILYKDMVVGNVFYNDSIVTQLYEDFSYLKECFEKEVRYAEH